MLHAFYDEDDDNDYNDVYGGEKDKLNTGFARFTIL